MCHLPELTAPKLAHIIVECEMAAPCESSGDLLALL
jgi:hypothetical protein